MNKTGKPAGRLYIISGPSGSGKDTLIKALLQKNPELCLSVSVITRPPRGEADYEKYSFASVGEFERMIAENKLLEYNEYLGNYYGTPREPVERWLTDGFDVLLEIDVNGAFKIREQMPEALSVFILPPSMAVLKERLQKRRTENEEATNRRLAAAVSEIERAGEYDYIVVNDVLEEAADAINAIIMSNKFSVKNMRYKITEVLENA